MSLHDIRIGCTGSSITITPNQAIGFVQLTYRFLPSEFHHGDSAGADVQCAALVHFALCGVRIICHPPKDESGRGWYPSDEYRPHLSHFARNREIVRETDILIAFPWQIIRQDTGGTWYTIYHACKLHKPVIIVYPNGDIQPYNELAKKLLKGI